MEKISGLAAVVLTKNEEKNIERCLNSLQFCSEILLVDDHSTDNTLQLAEKYNALVYSHTLEDFASQRNYAMEYVKGDWMLFIDADEVVTKELAEEIKQVLLHDSLGHEKKTTYYIRRRDYWWGNELSYGEIMTAKERGFIRLVKKNSGKWVGKVHEEYIPKGLVGHLRNFIDHYPHQTIKEFLHGINSYSTLRAKELYKQGNKTSVWEILLLPSGKFIWNYFLKLGFLDGAAGFAYAFFMSFHSFLVRAKLYQYRNIDVK